MGSRLQRQIVIPFAVGRVLEILDDAELLIQWYGAKGENPMGCLAPRILPTEDLTVL